MSSFLYKKKDGTSFDDMLSTAPESTQINKRYAIKLFEECESVTESKGILDSLRATQDNILLIYNEIPMVKKMKESIDSQLSFT